MALDLSSPPLPQASPSPDWLPPLVGRQRELQLIDASLERLQGGVGGLLVFTGEAGIGKSRLLEELQERSPTAVDVLMARCIGGTASPPYAPWTNLLRQLEARLTDRGQIDAAKRARENIDELVNGGAQWDHDRNTRFNLFEEIAALLKEVAKETPTVLLLDDLHLADPASLLLLGTVVGESFTPSLLVVTTYRDTDVEDEGPRRELLGQLSRFGPRTALRGLSPLEIAELLGSKTSPGTTDLTETLCRRSGGNPFFLIEILRFLKESDESDGLPPAVRDAIAQRVRPLPTATRRVLEAAAVLGDSVHVPLLIKMSDDASSMQEVLTSLQAAISLIRFEPKGESHDRFRFKHALVREAIYEEIPLARRSSLHARAAHALTSQFGDGVESPLDEILHHALSARPEGDPRQVIALARRAARAATKSYAYERAATDLLSARDALSWMERENTAELKAIRLDVTLELAEVFERMDDRTQARRCYLEAADFARRLGDAPALGRAILGMNSRGDILLNPDVGDLESMRQAIDELGDQAPEVRVALLGRYAKALYYTDQQERRFQTASRAIEIARERDDDGLIHNAITSRHFAVWGPDEEADRGAAATHAIAAGRRRDDPDLTFGALFWRLTDALERVDVANAEADIEQFASLANHRSEPFYLWRTAIFRAARVLWAGRLVEAEHQIEHARELGRKTRSPNVDFSFFLQRGILFDHRGEASNSVMAWERLAEIAPLLPFTRCGLGAAIAQAGQLDRAREYFEQAALTDFNLPRDHFWIFAMTRLARTCGILQDTARAEILLRRLEPFADRVTLVGWLEGCEGSVAHWVGLLAALTGRTELACSLLRQAIGVNRRLAASPYVAQGQHELGELLRNSKSPHERREAEALLGCALETKKRLGMPPGLPIETPRKTPPPTIETPGTASYARFQREADFWRLHFEGQSCLVKDAKGVRYLAALIGRPRKGISVLELQLVANGSPPTTPVTSRYTEMSEQNLGAEGLRSRRVGRRAERESRTASRSLTDRMRHIRMELEEAEACADFARLDALKQENQSLVLTLRETLSGDHAERARKAVTNAIRYAIGRIRKVDPNLGSHLDRYIKTGAFCTYEA